MGKRHMHFRLGTGEAGMGTGDEEAQNVEVNCRTE